MEDIVAKLQPKGYWQTVQITERIARYAQDILVKISPYGEITKVENPFLKLPINAQKKIISFDYHFRMRCINHTTELLIYKYSILIFLYHKRSLTKLVASPKINFNHIKNPWIRELYQQWEIDNDRLVNTLKWLLITIEKSNPRNRIRIEPPEVVTQYILNNKTFLFSTVLLKIADFTTDQSALRIYYFLTRSLNSTIITSLRMVLKSIRTQPNIKNFLLRRMNDYDYPDPELIRVVISFYYSITDPNFDYRYIIGFLERHNCRHLEQIAWEVFEPLKKSSCEVAFDVLIKQQKEERIYHYLRVQLFTKGKPMILRHTLKFLAKLPDRYQISSSYLLDLQVLEEERYYPRSCRWIALYLARILRSQLESSEEVCKNIERLLKHSRARIRQAGVLIIDELHRLSHPTFAEYFMEELLQFLRLEQVATQVSVLHLFGRLDKRYHSDELIKLVGRKTQKRNLRLTEAAKNCEEKIKQNMERS